MRHPKKQIRGALETAVAEYGCDVEEGRGHWGLLHAPNGQQMSISGTPRDADTHAKQIIRFARRNQN